MNASQTRAPRGPHANHPQEITLPSEAACNLPSRNWTFTLSGKRVFSEPRGKFAYKSLPSCVSFTYTERVSLRISLFCFSGVFNTRFQIASARCS